MVRDPVAKADRSAEMAGRGVGDLGERKAVLDARGDDKPVVVDSGATYFGTPVDDFSLVTGEDGVLTQTRFADWMARR